MSPVPRPRSPDRTVHGTRGAVATSHPLAAEAGIHLLREGGTAADAAVGMAAALTVVEPTSNGIGGDAFALVWAEGGLHGLHGCGRSPRKLTLEAARAAAGPGEPPAFPVRGWLPVTVPGAPAAWRDLNRRFGRLPLARVLDPAVRLAEGGHPVAPLVAYYWKKSVERMEGRRDLELAGWAATFLPAGRAPAAGEIVRLPDHARTLLRIGASGAESFYGGDLARRVDAFSRETGGLLRAEDLAAHRGEWADPVSARFHGVELWELRPPGQGIVALSALAVLDGLPPGEDWDDPRGVHEAIEAVKLAFADAGAHLADPHSMRVPPAAFLERGYLARRREAIGERAEARESGIPDRGGTVYLAAADGDGMMVSFIQSNYMGFGSMVVVPGTGIALQNRGAGFRLDPAHPNAAGPGKVPFHTIIPGFLTREGKPWGPVGVMGGHMQPQGHVQVTRGLVDHGLTPRSALDLPRWCWSGGNGVEVEEGWPEATVAALRDRGHEVSVAGSPGVFGRGQVILRTEAGTLAAATDVRADGLAIAF